MDVTSSGKSKRKKVIVRENGTCKKIKVYQPPNLSALQPKVVLEPLLDEIQVSLSEKSFVLVQPADLCGSRKSISSSSLMDVTSSGKSKRKKEIVRENGTCKKIKVYQPPNLSALQPKVVLEPLLDEIQVSLSEKSFVLVQPADLCGSRKSISSSSLEIPTTLYPSVMLNRIPQQIELSLSENSYILVSESTSLKIEGAPCSITTESAQHSGIINSIPSTASSRPKKSRKRTAKVSLQERNKKKTEDLFVVAKEANLLVVKKLISEGADPLATNINGDTNLFHVLYNRMKSTCECDYYSILLIVKYLMNLSQQSSCYSYKLENMYYDMILFMAPDLPLYPTIVFSILKLMLTYNKNINTFIYEVETDKGTMHAQVLKMNPISLLIYYHLSYSPRMFQNTYDNIDMMLEVGLSLKETAGCVTALTVLFLSVSVINDILDHKSKGPKFTALIDDMIKNGVNIESSVISLQYFYEIEFEEFNAMKIETMLPDVLYLSLMRMIKYMVDKFLPHWWAPPLALMHFSSHRDICIDGLCPYFSNFLTFGGVPHGTKIFELLKSVMEDPLIIKNPEATEERLAELNNFQISYKELVASPMRLQDLAKYAIRKQFAKTSILPGSMSLHTLLKQAMPSLLYRVCTEHYKT